MSHIQGRILSPSHPLRRLQPWADLIGAVGALLLFFNWVWTTNVAETRSSALAKYQTAEQMDRQSEDVLFLAGSIREVSWGVSLVQATLLEVDRHLAEGRLAPGEEEGGGGFLRRFQLRDARIQFERASLSQIDLTLRHCRYLGEQLKVEPVASANRENVGALCDELDQLRQRKDDLLQEAQDANRGPYARTKDETAEAAVQAIIRESLDEILPEFDEVRRQFSDVLASRVVQFGDSLREAEARSSFAKAVGIWLYGIGAALVLLRTILKEGIPASPTTSDDRTGNRTSPAT